MRELVIVSSWRRPEYLNQCLAALKAARGSSDRDIHIFQNDRPADGVSGILSVTEKYGYRVQHHEAQSWMASQRYAFAMAYYSEAPYVYFFSDDVIAAPDFFDWHEEVRGDWWGSTAWRPPTGQVKHFDPAAYYVISYPNEISMGLCVKHEVVHELMFGWPSQEQMVGRKVVMPYVQRCYHIGGFSSHEGSVGENTGPAVDVLPNPIPDYGRQKMVLKS